MGHIGLDGDQHLREQRHVSIFLNAFLLFPFKFAGAVE